MGGNIDLTEYSGDSAYKKAVLSKSPCDLTGGIRSAEGISAPIYYSVGSNTNGWAVLEPNTTYYYNVVNRQNGIESCLPGANGAAPNCMARVQLAKPSGLGALPAGTPNYSTASCSSGGGGGGGSALCGQAVQYNFTSIPTTNNLCTSPATASSVNGSGPWTWTCSITGGTSTSCTANVAPVVHPGTIIATINVDPVSIIGLDVTYGGVTSYATAVIRLTNLTTGMVEQDSPLAIFGAANTLHVGIAQPIVVGHNWQAQVINAGVRISNLFHFTIESPINCSVVPVGSVNNDCSVATNFAEIKAACCPIGTITYCLDDPKGARIKGINCN